MLTVRSIRDITQPCFERQTELVPWREGATVADYLPAELRGKPVLAQLNGGAVPLDAQVADGAELVFAPRPRLGGVLLNLAISAALSFAAMKLAPKPEPPKASRRGRTIYNFAGLSNSFEEGVPVPYVYGEHRVAGPVLTIFSRKPDDEGDRLWMMTALSMGQIEEVLFDDGTLLSTDQDDLEGAAIPDTIEINENPIDKVRNAKVSLRMGTSSQTHVPDFSDIVTARKPPRSTPAPRINSIRKSGFTPSGLAEVWSHVTPTAGVKDP